MWPCSVGHKVFKAVSCHLSGDSAPATPASVPPTHTYTHTPPHTTKMTLFGFKCSCSVPSVSNLQHLSFLVRSVKVHGCSRWELIPRLTSWHSPHVVVYPQDTDAYISIHLPCVIFFWLYQPTNLKRDWFPTNSVLLSITCDFSS